MFNEKKYVITHRISLMISWSSELGWKLLNVSAKKVSKMNENRFFHGTLFATKTSTNLIYIIYLWMKPHQNRFSSQANFKKVSSVLNYPLSLLKLEVCWLKVNFPKKHSNWFHQRNFVFKLKNNLDKRINLKTKVTLKLFRVWH